MRKLLIALALILPVVLAAPVPTIGPAGCNGETTLPIDTGVIPLATWNTATFACAQADKLFSNFALTAGTVPSDTGVRVTTYPLGADVFHALRFESAAFTNPFTVEYDVVVTNPNPLVGFKRVSADVINLAQVGQPSLTKKIYQIDPTTYTVTALLGGITAYYGVPPAGGCTAYPCQPFMVPDPFGPVRGLHIVDIYNPGGGGANALGNAYLEGVPEPSTMALYGAGLIALSLLRRRK